MFLTSPRLRNGLYALEEWLLMGKVSLNEVVHIPGVIDFLWLWIELELNAG